MAAEIPVTSPGGAAPSDEELTRALAQREAAIRERDALRAEIENIQRELGEGERRIAALREASATAAHRAHEPAAAGRREGRHWSAATALGRAYAGMETVAIGEIETSDDHRLMLAAGEGMRTAVVVPIRDACRRLPSSSF